MLMARLNTCERWKCIRGTYDLINAIHRNRNKLRRQNNAVHLEIKKKQKTERVQPRNEIFALEPV